MDEFDLELRINELGRAYSVTTAALNRARLRLHFLRADPKAAPVALAQAQTRFDVCERKKRALQTELDRLEGSTLPVSGRTKQTDTETSFVLNHRRVRG